MDSMNEHVISCSFVQNLSVRAWWHDGGMFIVVGVSGGIAAYKAVQLVRLLVKDGHDVHVVPTDNALLFVGQPTWEALSRNLVTTSVHDDVASVRHVSLGQRADLVVVAPATANTMAKMAAGIADDLLGTTLLATTAPVVIAPAMHTEMWRHPATQANASILTERGVHMIGPVSGELTGGDSGPGRMAEPEDIYAVVVRELARAGRPGGSGHRDPGSGSRDEGHPPGDRGSAGAARAHHDFGAWQAQAHDGSDALDAFAAGRRWLVTAGGTREPLDPVRFIGNRSSGKQGIEVALAAAASGAEVTLVVAHVEDGLLAPVVQSALPDGVHDDSRDGNASRDSGGASPSIRVLRVGTTAELEEVVVMAAAVSDYRLAEVSDEKLRKETADGTLTLTLIETTDILAGLAEHRQEGQVIVGFAAETPGEMTLIERAMAKRQRKGCDLLAANEVGWDKGFERADNHLIIVDEQGVVADVSGSKRDTAEALVTAILTR
jgi:phosphopantothenoylcysteine decarboxylase/phosphopantothenate--cysteine ligase